MVFGYLETLILWKPKTEDKVSKYMHRVQKNLHCPRGKASFKRMRLFGEFRASFRYQFKLDGTVGISDSVTFLQKVVDNKAHLQGLAISARKHPMFSTGSTISSF